MDLGTDPTGGDRHRPVQDVVAGQEKQIESQSNLAAEKSAQYAQHMERFESRLRVLEQIVTDGGAQTAAQIEALRDQARIPMKDDVQ